jgi:hypothetical protein
MCGRTHHAGMSIYRISAMTFTTFEVSIYQVQNHMLRSPVRVDLSLRSRTPEPIGKQYFVMGRDCSMNRSNLLNLLDRVCLLGTALKVRTERCVFLLVSGSGSGSTGEQAIDGFQAHSLDFCRIGTNGWDGSISACRINSVSTKTDQGRRGK